MKLRFVLISLALLGCRKEEPPPPAPAPVNVPVPMPVEPAPEAPAPEPPSPRLTPKDVHAVLHLGDSMVGFRRGLTLALEQRFKKESSAKFFSNSLTSAQVKSFDEDERLGKLIQKAKPDIIILNLGSNNVLNPNPEVLAGNIRSIVKKMQPAACYWLGPPLPIKAVQRDKGIRRVIAENIEPCKFFDTSRLVLERQTDHIHPTDRGGEVWADAVWHFIFDDEASHHVDTNEKGPYVDTKATHAKR
ncbi:SGNH/GDSL hydrolase family protein [Pendulispora rubella]|uniref:SGNH/GDSL hydrolase family protein n=1 Tax=Pendulispora rubella TaxID=2741070 RepID=A0ABZ2LGX4_9BACT